MQNTLDERSAPELAETRSTAPPVDNRPQEQEVFTSPESASTAPSFESSVRQSPDVFAPPTERQPRREWGAQDLPLRPRGFLLIALVLLVALIGGIGGGIIGARLLPAQSPRVSDVQQALENVSQGALPSVVELLNSGTYGAVQGSGVIVTNDGYIVTNDHLVKGYKSYTVTLSTGRSLPARVVGEDPMDDLAVIKVAANNLTPITLADSKAVAVGQFVVALGTPVSMKNTATFGNVSALNRGASEAPAGPATELGGLIQTDVVLNPGNSGGALVDLHGQMIGMPTLGIVGTPGGSDVHGIGFAISSNRIKYVEAQLIQHGRLVSSDQGFLGVQGQDVTPSSARYLKLAAQRGVLIMGFTNATTGVSPAQQAGVKANDIITAVNGQAISGEDELASATLTRPPNSLVTLTVIRGSKQQTITAALGERPVSG